MCKATQLLEQNRASALAAGNIFCFRVSGEDARVLACSYDTTPTQPHVVGEEPIRAPAADPIGQLTRRGHTNPTVAQFVADYLQPLETLVRNVSAFHGPFEFGCMLMRNIHVTGGRQLLNDCLFEVMRTGKADLFIQPLALLVLSGAVDDGVTEIFDKFQQYAIFRPQEFPGLDASANYFGHPSFLDDPRAEEVILKKYAKKRYYDDVFRSRIVTPGPSFIRMLRSLRQTMAILAREPILVDTGQYRPRLQPRLYSDMEGEIARDLTNAPNFQAKVKIG